MRAGLLQPPLVQVHADDPLRARQPRARDGTEADEARAEDRARRAALHLGDVERGADAGGRATGQRRDHVQRRLRVDLGQRDRRHDRRLGERRGPHEVADALIAAVQARRRVGQVAEVLLLADRQAEVGLVAAAVQALATLRREERDDVIADREVRDALPQRLDDARALVAEDRRRVARRVGARRRVHVGVADPARVRAGRAPRPDPGRRGRPPGPPAAGRTPRGRRRGSSWRRP